MCLDYLSHLHNFMHSLKEMFLDMVWALDLLEGRKYLILNN